MKSKLKKPAALGSMELSAYLRKLKTDLTALKEVTSEQPASFVIHTDFEFEDESNILFVAGINNTWKRFIKEEGWLKSPEIKHTLVGECVREDDEIELRIKRGKLKKTEFRKAIRKNKILKRFKWEVVEDFDEDNGLDNLTVDEGEEKEVTSEEQQQHKAKAESIARKLTGLVRQLQAATDKSQKQQLMQQIGQEAEALYIIPDWEDYTDDRLEKALSQIDASLEKQQDNPAQHKADAEKIVKEMVGIIKNIKTAEGQAKEELMEELDSLRDELDDIPNWKDYTPDKIEDILEKVEKTLSKSKSKEEATEEKVSKKETDYFSKAKELRSTMYKELSSFEQGKVSEQVTSIQEILKEWKTFEEKVLKKPKIADALQHQKELTALQKEFKEVATVLSTIEPDMKAFQKAIKEKNKEKALELQKQITAQLP